jgi:hypothetical protein
MEGGAEMSERPTPETYAETMRDEYDHVDSDFGPFAPSDTVPADFARRIERERDEALAKLESLERSILDLSHPNLRMLLQERDEARDHLTQIHEYGTEEINAAVELRQHLAAALVERDEARAQLTAERALADRLASTVSVLIISLNAFTPEPTTLGKDAYALWKEARK